MNSSGKEKATMKVAIVHDWCTGMRGGEKVLEVICELWPKADLYTLLYMPGKLSPIIEKRKIFTSFIQKLPKAATWYRNYLPLFPKAIEKFDLSNYDLVISTSHCVAKGVITKKKTCHISYIHTPMRYVWEMFDEYFGPGRIAFYKRIVAKMFRSYLQKWDVKSSKRVDAFIANSHNVKKRIKRHYNRTAEVIHPPVSAENLSISDKVKDYYLIVSAFAPYKRIDLAIEAFRMMGRPLKIVGGGQDADKLMAIKPPNVEFLGSRSDAELRELYSKCKAFIFPGEEDFGITPLEAQASGRPVIAFGKGGALETVKGVYPGEAKEGELYTGIFFKKQKVHDLCTAVEYLEKENPIMDPQSVREHVLSFDRPIFKEKIKKYVEETYEEFRRNNP